MARQSTLILASSSATRSLMLEKAGVIFQIEKPLVDEDALKQSVSGAGTSARNLADYLAEMKARAVGQLNPDDYILGCDQTLECDATMISKSSNREDAHDTLSFLSGKKHQLHSAAVIWHQGRPVWRHVDSATLTMRNLKGADIDRYLDRVGDDAFWSVGCYQVEGIGATLFSDISGSHFTILGLPLLPLLAFLRMHKLLDI